MPVPLGEPIRWSEMDNADELFIQMATPTPEEIEEIKAAITALLSVFLDAPLLEQDDIIGPT